MRHRAPVAGLMLAVVGTFPALWVIAPKWYERAGLDFWDYEKMTAWVRAEDARDRDLDTEVDQQRRRDAACDQIASDVCEYRRSVRDAIGDLTALAESAPGWWMMLRNQYRFLGLPLSASDRDAVTLLLRMRIELIGSRAERSGDDARVKQVTERLASFDDEVRELGEEVVVTRARP